MSILVIDDDPGVGRLARVILSAEGFSVEHATTAEEGERLAVLNAYRCIVLDLGLGHRSGVDVLHAIRRRGVTIPVLVLTAETDETMVVQALDAGADEYIVKPIRNRELAARVRALIRRNESPSAAQELSVGALRLDRLTRKAFVSTVPMSLSPREFALLEHLMLRADRVVSREELLRHVWEMAFDPGSNVVDVHVNRLRRKLRHAGSPTQIETRRGSGFVLCAAPAAAQDTAAAIPA